MRQTVFGIFDTADEAQNAVKQLLNNGFNHDVIDVRAQRSTDSGNRNRDRNDSDDSSISNFFSNLFGGDNDESRTYSEVARRGSVVTVHATSKDEADRAARILDEYGAVDANERGRKYRTEGTRGTGQTGEAKTQGSIPVVEEKMEIGKREVETGGVRVRSRIIERPVEEKLRLREEHIDVDRRKVDRPATDADLKNFKEGTTEVTEHAEKPVVNKEARVVEEVNLNKETKERTQTIRDSVRKQDVDVKKTNTNKDRESDRRDR